MFNGVNQKGLTLVEILISVGIFALVLVGIMGTLIISVDLSRKINYEYAATNLAKKRVETARTMIKTQGFWTLFTMEEEEVLVNADGMRDSDGEFVRTTKVDTNYGNPRLTKVEVEIYYSYRGEETTPFTMATIFTNVE